MENISTLQEKDKGDFLFYMFMVLAVLLGAMLGAGFAASLSSAYGTNMATMFEDVNEDSPLGIRNLLRASNGISHFLTFSVSSIVFAIYFFGASWWSKLDLNRIPSAAQLVGGSLFVILSFPFIQLVYWINRQMPLPEYMTKMEASAEKMLEAILNMQGPNELLINILIIGLLPAVGEELLFRGLLQKRIERYFRSAVPAIWIAAVVFSAFHMQFEGFLPRLVLGAMLGYLFYWSKSLWLPIAAHFLFNSLQVAGQYFFTEQMEQIEKAESIRPNWLMGVISLIVVLGIGFLMQKK